MHCVISKNLLNFSVEHYVRTRFCLSVVNLFVEIGTESHTKMEYSYVESASVYCSEAILCSVLTTATNGLGLLIYY